MCVGGGNARGNITKKHSSIKIAPAGGDRCVQAGGGGLDEQRVEVYYLRFHFYQTKVKLNARSFVARSDARHSAVGWFDEILTVQLLARQVVVVGASAPVS